MLWNRSRIILQYHGMVKNALFETGIFTIKRQGFVKDAY